MKKLAIFGATGPTGRLLVQNALEAEYQVTALVRTPADFELTHQNLRVEQGDVLDADAVERVVQGQNAVISVIGTRYSFKPINVYSVGAQHIVDAMRKHRVKRLVCVTAGGTNPYYDRQEGIVFGLLIKRIIGRTLYKDMRRMEQIVMQSDLDWTIVRPARLIDTPSQHAYRVGIGYILPNGTQTSRSDLAECLLKQVNSYQYNKKAIALASDS